MEGHHLPDISMPGLVFGPEDVKQSLNQLLKNEVWYIFILKMVTPNSMNEVFSFFLLFILLFFVQ